MDMTAAPSSITGRIFMAVIAIVTWFALGLQFPLSIAVSRSNGMTIVGAVVTYFSFFTILTNLLVALTTTILICAPNSRLGQYFSRPVVTAGVAIHIAVVGAVYSVALRHLWDPEGLQRVADIILHDTAPPLYVAFWLIFGRKRGLQWSDVLWWLIYPLVYLSFVLFRGALTGRYPYPFIDAGALGYSRVLLNAAMLLGAFVGAGLLVIAASRWANGDWAATGSELR